MDKTKWCSEYRKEKVTRVREMQKSKFSTPKFDFLISVDCCSNPIKILKPISFLLNLPDNKETLFK